MTARDIDDAARILKFIGDHNHKADPLEVRMFFHGQALKDDTLSKSDIEREEMIMRYLGDIGLIRLFGGEVGMADESHYGDWALTAIGVDAYAMGLRAWIKQRDERDRAQHRANLATAWGYSYGRALTWIALGISVINLLAYLFQVFGNNGGH